MAVVLGRLGQAGRVVDAIVVEKHALYLVTLGQRSHHELVGTIGRLVGVGPFTDEQTEFHGG